MKVLVADDDPVSLRLLESSLSRWGYDVVKARDGLDALRILQEEDPPKLLVLDWMMPGLDGLQLCQRIRDRQNEPYTYILLLTGKKAKADVVQGLDAGADDYIAKPFDPDELQVRLRTGKRILYLQEQLISAREALREQATHDPLTGLWNHGAIVEILATELARQKRHGGSLGVLLADIDHFKQINDVHGHLVGDAVLQHAATTMRNATRRYDATGRLGGEEFLIVLPGCNQTNAMSHAERMRREIEQTVIETSRGVVSITASLGVTTCEPGFDGDVTQMIRTADAALYQAKREGRNRVCYGDVGAALVLN
jgi:diguanylate cyclase (GGDEF)-like protein